MSLIKSCLSIEFLLIESSLNTKLECGNSFIRVSDRLKYFVNAEGREVIFHFNEGIQELRHLIANGDVAGLSSNFRNIGAAGMRQIEQTTNNVCLKRVFRSLADLDENIADQLEHIKEPYDAGVIICNILKYKAKQIGYCID